VRARAADAAKALDDGDFLAVFPGLHGRPFAAGTRADDEKIVLMGCHAVSLLAE
jgi:hypothetical protein